MRRLRRLAILVPLSPWRIAIYSDLAAVFTTTETVTTTATATKVVASTVTVEKIITTTVEKTTTLTITETKVEEHTAAVTLVREVDFRSVIGFSRSGNARSFSKIILYNGRRRRV